MKKRISALLCLATLIVILSTSFSYAGSLDVETYPKDGQKDVSIENFGVKVYFDGVIKDKKTIKANQDCFKIIDPNGKSLPLRVFYNPKVEGQALVMADVSDDVKIEGNTEYKFIISEDFKDDNGNVLGKELAIKYKTINMSMVMKVNMIMMFAMFGGIFFFSSRSMKKQAAKEHENDVVTEAFNPYKEAKRTGKSVSEVIAEHEREVAKAEAKAARKAAKKKTVIEEEEVCSDNYRVKGPRPISAGNGKYSLERKAKEKGNNKSSNNKKKK